MGESDGRPADIAARRRVFHHVLGNTLVVSVMDFTVWFAVTFFVYLETRSVFATGVIAGIFLALTALSGLWFGSLVDHHRKKTMMLAPPRCRWSSTRRALRSISSPVAVSSPTRRA